MLIVIALLNPLGLPLRISVMTQTLYDRIESLPPGSRVAFNADIEPGTGDEYGPCAGAVLTHLFRRPLKVIMLFFTPDGPLMFDRLLRLRWGEISLDKKYGVDYVNLGYLAGVETAMASAAADLHKAFPKDYYGTSLEELPLMKDVKGARDFQLLIQMAGGTNLCESMVRQWQGTYGVPMAWIVGASQVPPQMPYYPRQVFAILGGTRPAAEYELLIRRPRVGLQNSDSLSFSQVFIIAYVVLGNIIFFAKKRSKKGEKA